jgi:hypothetical protein
LSWEKLVLRKPHRDYPVRSLLRRPGLNSLRENLGQMDSTVDSKECNSMKRNKVSSRAAL